MIVNAWLLVNKTGNKVRSAFNETCITRAFLSFRYNRNVDSNSAKMPNWISSKKKEINHQWKSLIKPNRELSWESVDTNEHWLLNELVNDDIGGEIVSNRTVVSINFANKFAQAPRKCVSPCSRKDNRYVITSRKKKNIFMRFNSFTYFLLDNQMNQKMQMDR